jgi:thiamine-phosphate pyrophosphorylase
MENKYLAYYFIDNINSETKLLIKKFKKITLIYLNNGTSNKIENLYSIKEFCRKNKINLYVSDDFKLAIKIRANGLYLTENNKTMNHRINQKKDFINIGVAHNQLEFFKKKQQKIDKIFLSPIFKTKKYSKNKILETLKFRIISMRWKTNVIPLGGINQLNLKRIKTLNVESFGFKSWRNNTFAFLLSLPAISLLYFFR